MNGIIITNEMIKKAQAIAVGGAALVLFMFSMAAQSQELKPVEAAKPAHVEYVSYENFAPAMSLQTLAPTSNGDQMAQILGTRVVNKISDDLLKHTVIQSSPIMKTMASVDQNAQTHLHLGSSKNGGIDHSINFNLKTLERQAVIDYKGFFESRIAYLADNNSLNISVVRPLFRDTTLNITSLSNFTQGSQENKITLNYKF